jgi:heme-degrading monooxygenase HmoA
MVRHLALWTLTEQAKKEGIDAAAKKINESARMMLGEIPGLLCIEVSRNISPESVHDVALYSELESEDALKTYQTHPAHIAHKTRVKDYVSNREIIDLMAT